jgi:hypothetical protein
LPCFDAWESMREAVHPIEWPKIAAPGETERGVSLTRHDDETARGIVIPLAAIASVCLLLTCGVFLFSGPDDGPDAPVSLRVPTAAGPLYLPPTPAGSPSTGATASATPSTRASVSPTATKSATRTPSGLPTASRGPTTAAPPVPPPSLPSIPANPSSPQPPPPVPPVTTRPAADPAKDVDVVAVASSSPWYTSGSVTITNDTPHTLNTWDLRLVSSGRNGFDMFIGDNMRMSTQGNTATATGTRPLAPHASVTILFSLSGRVDSMGCTFTGVPCRVRGIG